MIQCNTKKEIMDMKYSCKELPNNRFNKNLDIVNMRGCLFLPGIIRDWIISRIAIIHACPLVTKFNIACY